MKTALIIVILIGILNVVIGLPYWIYPNDLHYDGKNLVTPEQYTEIILNDKVSQSDASLKKLDDGTLELTYDFYSSESYVFLDHNPRSFYDSQIFHILFVGFIQKRGISVVLGVVLVFGLIIRYIHKKPRKFYSKIIKVFNWMEHKLEVSLPDVQEYRIVNKVDQISPNGSNGIICVRSWKERNCKLKSIVRDTIWETKEMVAPKLPTKDGNDGLNAYRLGSQIEQKSKIMGIVEMGGKYEYHSDGVIRSEYCKIIGLFMSNGNKKLAQIISHNYGLPVFLADEPIDGYNKWLFSPIGQSSLIHNFKILEEGINVNS